MRRLCRRLKPEGLEDLSALNALYPARPDRWRHGWTISSSVITAGRQVRYDFPEMKEIMGNTLGICVYQEQIMAVFHRSSPAIRWAKPTSCAARWARRSAKNSTSTKKSF